MFLKIKLHVDGGDDVVVDVTDLKRVLCEGYACVRCADPRDSGGVEIVTKFMKLGRHLQMLQSWDRAFLLLLEGNGNTEWGCNLFVEVGGRCISKGLQEVELVEEKLRYFIWALFKECDGVVFWVLW